jgi:hypothetical protein
VFPLPFDLEPCHGFNYPFLDGKVPDIGQVHRVPPDAVQPLQQQTPHTGCDDPPMPFLEGKVLEVLSVLVNIFFEFLLIVLFEPTGHVDSALQHGPFHITK